MALTPKRLFLSLSLCISVSLLRLYTFFFSRSHLVSIFSLKMRVSSKELFSTLKTGFSDKASPWLSGCMNGAKSCQGESNLSFCFRCCPLTDSFHGVQLEGASPQRNVNGQVLWPINSRMTTMQRAYNDLIFRTHFKYTGRFGTAQAPASFPRMEIERTIKKEAKQGGKVMGSINWPQASKSVSSEQGQVVCFDGEWRWKQPPANW